MRGGAYIVVRQGLGMVLSLIGVLFVTRVIGPANYGVFAASFGIVGFIATVGTWGIDVYLIRNRECGKAGVQHRLHAAADHQLHLRSFDNRRSRINL